MYDVKFYQEAAAACRAASRDARGRSSPYLLAMAEHYDGKAAALVRSAGDNKTNVATSATGK